MPFVQLLCFYLCHKLGRQISGNTELEHAFNKTVLFLFIAYVSVNVPHFAHLLSQTRTAFSHLYVLEKSHTNMIELR